MKGLHWLRLALLSLVVSVQSVFSAEISIIGDSLVVGSQKYIRNLFFDRRIHIDAQVGRQFRSAFDIIHSVKPGSIVVINLFNNSPVDYQEIESLVKILRDRNIHIVFVNTHVPRSWREYNNRNLQLIKLRYPEVYVLDWGNIINTFCFERNCLRSDGVHLTQEGSFYYALALYFVVHQAMRERYDSTTGEP